MKFYMSLVLRSNLYTLKTTHNLAKTFPDTRPLQNRLFGQRFHIRKYWWCRSKLLLNSKIYNWTSVKTSKKLSAKESICKIHRIFYFFMQFRLTDFQNFIIYFWNFHKKFYTKKVIILLTWQIKKIPP